MQSSGPLLVQGKPCEGESFRGFALRVAEANRLSGLGEFFGRSGKHFSLWERIADASLVERVSFKCGASREEVNRLGGVQVGPGMAKWGPLETALPKRFSGTESCRLCPRCLAESGYLQGIWEISLLTACPIHECRLVHECPNCGKPLSWTRSALLHCCKEAPLAAVQIVRADDRAVELSRLLASKFHSGTPEPSTRVCEQLRKLNGEQAAVVTLYAGLRPEDGGSDTAIYRARRDIDYAEDLLLRAGDALLDWPAGISAFTTAWDLSPGSACVRASDLGLLYARLRNQLKGPAYNFFRDEVLQRKVVTYPFLSRASAISSRLPERMAANTVRKVYGVGKRWLSEWTAHGALEMTTTRAGTNLRYLYDREQVENLIKQLAKRSSGGADALSAPRELLPNADSPHDGWISLSQSARELRTRSQEVVTLSQEGFIDGRVERGALYLDPDTLQNLLRRLAQIASGPDVGYRRLLRQGKLVRLNMRVDQGGTAKRLHAVFCGHLGCIRLGDGKGLSEFAIPTSKLAGLGMLAAFNRPWAGMAEACAILRCSPEDIRVLVAGGYLEAAPKLGSDGKSPRIIRVTRSSLAAFEKEWVLGSALFFKDPGSGLALADGRLVTAAIKGGLARDYGPPTLPGGGVHLWPRDVVEGQRR